jgi:hypothetical protein
LTEDSWRVEKVGGVTGEDVDDGECCDVQGPTLDSLGWYYASIVSLLDGLERFHLLLCLLRNQRRSSQPHISRNINPR